MRSFTVLLLSTFAVAPLAAQTTQSVDPAQDAAITPPAASAPAATTPAAAVTTGAKVVDTAGAPVGTIESVANGVATLSTGAAKVNVPIASFAAGASGPVIAMTKTEIEAKAAEATTAVTIAVGASVMDSAGAKVGTVKAVNGDMITVASASASAQLPKASFAKGDTGLVIGMTAAQFDAAAKAAGGAKPAAKG